MQRGICSEIRKLPLLLKYPIYGPLRMDAHKHSQLTALYCLQHHITNQTSSAKKCKQVSKLQMKGRTRGANKEFLEFVTYHDLRQQLGVRGSQIKICSAKIAFYQIYFLIPRPTL